LTTPLLSFWSRKEFSVCYVRQTANDITGEYSSIALRELNCTDLIGEENTPSPGWLVGYVVDYRQRLRSLMSFNFRCFESALALTLIDPEKHLTSVSNSVGSNDNETFVPAVTETSTNPVGAKALTATELLTVHLTHHDLKRLELYSRNMVDHHMILDLLPIVSVLFFQYRLGNVRLSTLQAAILLAVGLQRRDVDSIAIEMDLPANQILAFFNKSVRKITTYFRALVENDVAQELATGSAAANKSASQAFSTRGIFANKKVNSEITIKAESVQTNNAAIPKLVSLPKTVDPEVDGKRKREEEHDSKNSSAKKHKKDKSAR
jgi:N-acetyltransferase 10